MTLTRRTTARGNRGKARPSTKGRRPSSADLQKQLSEALEQQAATSEVLKVISSSPTDAQPVFDMIANSVARLCKAQFCHVFRFDGERIYFAASHGLSLEAGKAMQGKYPMLPGRATAAARSIVSGEIEEIPDVHADPEYEHGDIATIVNYRGIVAVPILKEGVPIGSIAVARSQIGYFPKWQIKLLQSFADQAVIAIENVRLFDEVQQRTEDLAESLQQQTATADVLKVISRSTFDLQTVLNTLVELVAQLCEADLAQINRPKDQGFYSAANYGYSREYIEFVKTQSFVPGRGTVLGRVQLEGKPVQIDDVLSDPEYAVPEIQALGGFRTHLGVPMLREGNMIGVLLVSRKTVRPFTDKQIELVQTFADQAVIAIENVRLFDEVQARTRELTESLEYQTATSDVLNVISRSPSDLQPVLDAIVQTAARLCSVEYAFIVKVVENGCHLVAGNRMEAEHIQYLANHPVAIDRSSVIGRVALERKSIHVPDVLSDPEFKHLEWQKVGKQRTVLGVPLLREDAMIGVIILARTHVAPFTEKQIELVTTFADQAVIAIENVRLFDEVKARTEELAESLKQQTATADVLKVISRSTFDLRTVLDTLLKSAAHLCDADQGTITQRKGEVFYRAVSYGFPGAFLEYVKDKPVEANRKTGTGRALAEGKVVHIPDVHNDPEFDWPEAQKLGGFRTMLGVPMLREGVSVGVLTLTRADVRPFTDKQIELVATFADQAAIAIENVRLFDEIQDKSRQLAEASQHKSQFLASMSHELRTPLNAILGYNELIVDGIYGAPPEKMQAVLKRVESNGRHLLGLINAVLDLSKIEAGQFTLDLADYSLQNVAQTVYNAVEPLAADKKLAFKADIQLDLPSGRGDERRLTQVLLNLVGNAIKFTDVGEVVIKAGAGNSSFELSVRDTGPGISAADQAKLFQEFQQAENPNTRKKEGTGLGLSISKRIVEMHGGRIWIELRLGQGSTFFVTLPVQVSGQVTTTN